MIITIEYYVRHAENFEPNYNKRRQKQFIGESAKDCMTQFDDYRNYHDLAHYTIPRIVNVED